MGSKKKATTKKKVTKKTAPKEESLFSENTQQIELGFEAMAKEYKDFKDEKIAYYVSQGIEVAIESHEAHWNKVFIMGKIHQLSELLKGEAKNDTKEKPATKQKRVSRKRTKRTRSPQLELGV